MRTRTRLTGFVIKALASNRAICIVLMLARIFMTCVRMSVMIVVSVIETNHVRNVHHHLLNIVTVRVTRVSVMHATTQQCMKHYGGHRRIGEEFVKHVRFVRTRTIGVLRLIVAVVLSAFSIEGYTEFFSGQVLHELCQSKNDCESLGNIAKPTSGKFLKRCQSDLDTVPS
ncbi:hypothetical protein K227x_35400 [Rubripirellula lacrimiformis]|uniref:Uncharacterized protein n=2 Tax=Rubripirellula lacrimiformis TaxID=1930273 RepID=A0A517NDD7_9BACT|nr:hypothetical protein K227x_35400 [Rubripirellula lacrimiformis]